MSAADGDNSAWPDPVAAGAKEPMLLTRLQSMRSLWSVIDAGFGLVRFSIADRFEFAEDGAEFSGYALSAPRIREPLARSSECKPTRATLGSSFLIVWKARRSRPSAIPSTDVNVYRRYFHRGSPYPYSVGWAARHSP
jgi:hypothetical protein